LFCFVLQFFFSSFASLVGGALEVSSSSTIAKYIIAAADVHALLLINVQFFSNMTLVKKRMRVNLQVLFKELGLYFFRRTYRMTETSF
jgi:hypothetical protein